MSVAITFLITLAMVTSVSFVLAEDMVDVYESVTGSWTVLLTRSESKADTRISGPTGLEVQATSTVQIVVTNDGDVALAQFPDWDVIFEIQESPGLGVAYLTYSSTTPPSTNKWALEGIYLNAASSTPDVIDPGVLNPGEEMVVIANPNPSIQANTYDRASFATPNGITAKVIFRVLP